MAEQEVSRVQGSPGQMPAAHPGCPTSRALTGRPGHTHELPRLTTVTALCSGHCQYPLLAKEETKAQGSDAVLSHCKDLAEPGCPLRSALLSLRKDTWETHMLMWSLPHIPHPPGRKPIFSGFRGFTGFR